MAPSIHSRFYKVDKVAVNNTISLAQRIGVPQESYPDSLIHTIVGSETLDQLAAKYYGREDLWWRIADANPNRFALEWQPGETLVIPPLRVATRMPRR